MESKLEYLFGRRVGIDAMEAFTGTSPTMMLLRSLGLVTDADYIDETLVNRYPIESSTVAHQYIDRNKVAELCWLIQEEHIVPEVTYANVKYGVTLEYLNGTQMLVWNRVGASGRGYKLAVCRTDGFGVVTNNQLLLNSSNALSVYEINKLILATLLTCDYKEDPVNIDIGMYKELDTLTVDQINELLANGHLAEPTAVNPEDGIIQKITIPVRTETNIYHFLISRTRYTEEPYRLSWGSWYYMGNGTPEWIVAPNELKRLLLEYVGWILHSVKENTDGDHDTGSHT